jgi:hypothetical protein
MATTTLSPQDGRAALLLILEDMVCNGSDPDNLELVVNAASKHLTMRGNRLEGEDPEGEEVLRVGCEWLVDLGVYQRKCTRQGSDYRRVPRGRRSR